MLEGNGDENDESESQKIRPIRLLMNWRRQRFRTAVANLTLIVGGGTAVVRNLMIKMKMRLENGLSFLSFGRWIAESAANSAIAKVEFCKLRMSSVPQRITTNIS